MTAMRQLLEAWVAQAQRWLYRIPNDKVKEDALYNILYINELQMKNGLT